MFKVNFDEAVFATQKEASLGVLIKYEKRKLVVALSKKVQAPLGALEIEVKAFEASISFARDVGILKSIIEGDSLIMSQALAEKTSPPALG